MKLLKALASKLGHWKECGSRRREWIKRVQDPSGSHLMTNSLGKRHRFFLLGKKLKTY